MTSNFAGLIRFLAERRFRAPRSVKRLSMLAAAGAVMIASAATAAPLEVALVEGLTGSPSVGLMDYLKTGQVIRLGPRDGLVVTYMSSCVRETITGGIVIIGTDWSEVQSGEVVRVRGQCGGDKFVLTSAQTAIGGRSFRGPSH
jgi:hypothetical protein